MSPASAVLLLLAMLALAACGTPPPAPPLRIGVVEWPGFYPLVAGVTDGAFARAGLSVEVRTYPDNPTLNNALRRQEVDLIAGAAADALLMRAQGVPVRILGALDTSDGADVLLARPGLVGLGVTPDQRIAFEGINSFSHLFVLHALAQAGVPEDRMLAYDLPASSVPAALLAGRLDIGHTWGVLAVAAQSQGCRIIARAGDHPGIITDVLATRQEVIAARPEELHRVVQAIYARQDHYRTRESDLLTAAAQFYGKPPTDLLPVAGQVRLVSREESLRAMVDLEQPSSLRRILQTQAELLRHRGQWPASGRVDDLLASRFLVP